MIIVQLSGGLGNQLFQYATGRAIAHSLGVPLKVDISAYTTAPLRTYRLANLCIAATVATQNDLDSVTGNAWTGIRHYFFERIQARRPYYRRAIVNEKKVFVFDPNLQKVRKNTLLVGYWQNQRYFQDIKALLQQEMKAKEQPSGKNLELLQRITATPSVSLHVRRGDYVTHPRHGVCSLEYYRAAIERITAALTTVHFFVFSDDMTWTRQHLWIDQPVTYVDHNGPDQDHEDLRLMSHCKHHIIANSTFSWWGAWLAEHPQKMVFAPRQWFQVEMFDTSDLCPQSWVKL